MDRKEADKNLGNAGVPSGSMPPPPVPPQKTKQGGCQKTDYSRNCTAIQV